MDWPCFETRRLLHEIIEGRMKGKPMKKSTLRRKHCTLAVVRRSQKISPTFTYKPSLVRIDARNFELSW